MEVDIMSMISTVGLPGAICLYTLMQVKKSVDANTLAITKLLTRMGVDSDGAR